MGKVIIGVAAIGAGLLWAGVSARQEVRPVPGPGTGVVTVRGTVDIGNAPDVSAAQRGDWRVAVSNVPTVRVANRTPGFVKIGGRYTVVWSGGDSEAITILDVADDGWVQVGAAGRRRWMNLAMARVIDESR